MTDTDRDAEAVRRACRVDPFVYWEISEAGIDALERILDNVQRLEALLLISQRGQT